MTKYTKITTLLAAVVLLLAVPYAGHAAEETSTETNQRMEAVKQRLGEIGEDIASYTAEQKEQAIDNMNELLVALDQQVDRMEDWTRSNWNRLSESARESRHLMLQNLRRARTETAEWMGSLRYSTAETWEEIKAETVEATEKLKDAYNKTVESAKWD